MFAAAIACTQTDLKRILAFSTLSQLGLMMFALGTGAAAYPASMFHIFTHAFFKCLLFLSAGVIIHAIHSNDIRDAGGLRKSMPRTYWTTLIAVLAIAGIFPFSGFFSKEEILHAALASGHYGAFLAGLVTSGLTAFYMSRYFFLVFHGSRKGASGHDDKPGQHSHPVREGLLMTLPLLVLAVPSAIIGWLGRAFFLAQVRPWPIGQTEQAGAHHEGAVWLPVVATLLALTGVAVSWYWYAKKGNGPGFPGRTAPVWYRVLSNKFYIDELYLFLAKRVGARWIAAPTAWVEHRIVNGAFDWASAALKRLAFAQSIFHSGQVQLYIAVALLGLGALAFFGGMGF